jgi:hypothetical protein
VAAGTVTAVNGSWIDFGSLPDWVEALGTSGALIFLGVQHRFDRRKDRAEREAAAELKRDEEMRQARLVTVTAGWNYSMDTGYNTTIYLFNESGQPLRNLTPVIEDRSSGSDQVDRKRSASLPNFPMCGHLGNHPREGTVMTIAGLKRWAAPCGSASSSPTPAGGDGFRHRPATRSGGTRSPDGYAGASPSVFSARSVNAESR